MQRIITGGIVVVTKDESRLMQLIAWLLRPVNPDFMTAYWTTPWDTIFAPVGTDVTAPDFEERHAGVLKHEMVHVRQFRRIGPVAYWLLYLFFPLPIFFAWGRYRFEREAYLTQVLAANPGSDRDAQIEWVVGLLGGSPYLWAWPKAWIRAWFKTQAARR